MANEQSIRERIVDSAMDWLGTPYHHRARIKGVGVDCAQILLAVYQPFGFGRAIDPGDYPVDWHMHHSDEMFERWIDIAGGRLMPEDSLPRLGDVLTWKFGNCYSHGSIYVGEDQVLHSYIRRGVIVTRLDEAPLQGRPMHIWSVV